MSKSSALSLKDYLKKYETTNQDQTKKKKKKKNTKSTTDAKGVLVVDEDPVWQKPVNLQQEEDTDQDSADEKPQIDEDIEVKRMKRLELLRSRKPYHAISDDGSGWVSVSENVANSNSVDTRYDTPSPEREKTVDNDGDDLSPPRRKRYYSPSPGPEGMQSNSIGKDSDLSPSRRPRSESVADVRRSYVKRSDSPDLSPPRKRKVESADLSPPRRRKVESDDLSPPRRRKVESADLSLPRRHTVESSDLSPPRRTSRTTPSTDLSPPRKGKKTAEARAGLYSGKEIKKEIDMKKKEEVARYKELDPSVSGRGAEPVYRDKDGKRISKEEVLKLQKGEEKPKEKKLEWGKGLAQKREAEAKEHELELEKDKPFARTRDDPDLDKMLKERVRWGDPMAHLVKRKHSDLLLEDLGDDEKMKESGFIIPQDIPSHSWIKRRIDAPPNRYGIRPGRHWDGVDRSTGYEKEYFKRTNEKQATEKEAYLWSVSDM